jgi:hypothetical protein
MLTHFLKISLKPHQGAWLGPCPQPGPLMAKFTKVSPRSLALKTGALEKIMVIEKTAPGTLWVAVLIYENISRLSVYFY